MTIRNIAGAVAGVPVAIPSDASRFTLRAVDATGVPVAFSVELVNDGGSTPPDFHFVAGEAYSEDQLKLPAGGLELVVKSAAASVVELIVWEASA